eukprot:jgi/Tetstr1/426124/TSEL_016452.t1
MPSRGGLVLKPSSRAGATRDLYGFEVKQEYVALFRKYAPLWEAEEVERQERWDAFLSPGSNGGTPGRLGGRRGPSSPAANSASAEKVQGLLDAWLDASGDAQLLEQQYQLRSLVQAGIPMSLRGALWKKFLGLPGIIVKGEYQRLLGQAAQEHMEEPPEGEDPYYIMHSSRQGQEWVQYVVDSGERRGGATHSESADNAAEALASAVELSSDTTSGQVEQADPDGEEVVSGVPLAAAAALVPPVLVEPLVSYPHTPPSGQDSPGGSCRDWAGQIEKDLHRTFPGHPVMDSYGRAALRRILRAYSLRNPCVGYCQGMNFVAGTLLLFMDEEDAFWCLTSIIENLMPGYYSLAMMAPQVDQRVFHRLIAEHFPTLSMHFESLCVDPACVTSHWFLCLFVNALPLETCLRVWDVLFLERDATVLFRSGLALVDIFSKALLKTVDSVEALCQLQATAPMMFDGSRLMTTACIGFQDISREVLLQYREEEQEEVFAGIKSRIDGMASEHDMEAYNYEVERFREMLDEDSDFNRRNYSRNLSANTSRRATGEEAAQAGPAWQTRQGTAAAAEALPDSSGPSVPSTAPPAMRGGRVSRFEDSALPRTQLFGNPDGAQRNPATPEPTGLGLTASRLQNVSQSPFKLLYILPEGVSNQAPATAPHHRKTAALPVDGELSRAALAAFEIASTPASQRMLILSATPPRPSLLRVLHIRPGGWLSRRPAFLPGTAAAGSHVGRRGRTGMCGLRSCDTEAPCHVVTAVRRATPPHTCGKNAGVLAVKRAAW